MNGAWVVFPLVGLAMMIVMMVFVTTMLRGHDQGSSRGWGVDPRTGAAIRRMTPRWRCCVATRPPSSTTKTSSSGGLS